jgi:hypothetical protein
MIRTFVLSLSVLVLLLGSAAADRRTAERMTRLAKDADSLARSADRSEDKEIRQKFADLAGDLSDDLTDLARRARKDTSSRKLAREASKLVGDARQLVDLADEATNRRERKTFRGDAERLERKISDLSRDLEAADDDDDDRGDRDRDRGRDRDRDRKEPPKPQPMSPDAFNALVSAINNESFESNKLGVVSSAAQGNNFLTSQIATVMDLFSFSDGKVTSAVTMWARVLDPQNSFVLYDKLTFSSDKDKLRQRIGR